MSAPAADPVADVLPQSREPLLLAREQRAYPFQTYLVLLDAAMVTTEFLLRSEDGGGREGEGRGSGMLKKEWWGDMQSRRGQGREGRRGRK